MLLNKILKKEKNKSLLIYQEIFYVIFISVLIVIFSTCGNEKKEGLKPAISFSDSVSVLNEAKKMFGDQMKVFIIGNFDEDSVMEAAVGLEIIENNVWGIKFLLLEAEENKLTSKFETNLLDGSFKESLVKKVKFAAHNYELIYYNSEDYFWGSGGGEVFSYIINFAKGEVFYAHLFTESRRHVELYLSENIIDKDVREFFISNFKKDYPDLRLVSEDVTLEY